MISAKQKKGGNARPKAPENTERWIKGFRRLAELCWDAEPSLRPTARRTLGLLNYVLVLSDPAVLHAPPFAVMGVWLRMNDGDFVLPLEISQRYPGSLLAAYMEEAKDGEYRANRNAGVFPWVLAYLYSMKENRTAGNCRAVWIPVNSGTNSRCSRFLEHYVITFFLELIPLLIRKWARNSV